jgi:hypothetical protein
MTNSEPGASGGRVGRAARGEHDREGWPFGPALTLRCVPHSPVVCEPMMCEPRLIGVISIRPQANRPGEPGQSPVTAVVVETHDEWQVADRRYWSETFDGSAPQEREDGHRRAFAGILKSRPLVG